MKTVTEITTYEQDAIDFLKNTNVTLTITFKENGYHFAGNTETRDIYKITLERKGRKMSFDFGQSINNSGFYCQIGRKKVMLERKWMDKPNLIFNIKMMNIGFIPKVDTIHYPTAPTAYDILTCLTKYDPGSFENFCSDFGYDTDSKTAEKTYKAVCKEFEGVERLWSPDEIELLQEIQ